MGGNIQAESGIRSNNVEDRSGMGDAQYTAMVDAGGYDFATDNGNHYGYGLCQWTLKSRKVELLQYAKNRGVSVADEDMQVDFAVHELKRDFSGLYKFLCSTDDMYTATDRICREFENPAVKTLLRDMSLLKNGIKNLEAQKFLLFLNPSKILLASQANPFSSSKQFLTQMGIQFPRVDLLPKNFVICLSSSQKI